MRNRRVVAVGIGLASLAVFTATAWTGYGTETSNRASADVAVVDGRVAIGVKAMSFDPPERDELSEAFLSDPVTTPDETAAPPLNLEHDIDPPGGGVGNELASRGPVTLADGMKLP